MSDQSSLRKRGPSSVQMLRDEVAGDQQERATDTAGAEDGASVSGGDAFKDRSEEGHEVAC